MPLPNLLLASVHHLLLREAPNDDLARFYPSLTAAPAPAASAFPAFREFCLARRGRIAALLRVRGVVTSEARRSACLLPGFLAFSRAVPRFHVIDVGAGAGFNLLWDRYRYDYGGAGAVGPENAPLTLRCALRGTPPLTLAVPAVLSRTGIDLQPPDLEDPADRDWLRALVWPEQADRRQRLEQAIAAVRALRPKILAGDALALLPGLLAALPGKEAACVSHAYCLNQWSEAQRRRLERILRTASGRRPVGRLALEWPRRGKAPQLRLYHYKDGRRTAAYLAQADAHGAWLAWRGADG